MLLADQTLKLTTCNIDPSNGRTFASMQKFDGSNVTQIQLNFAIPISEDDSIKKVNNQAKKYILELLREAARSMEAEISSK